MHFWSKLFLYACITAASEPFDGDVHNPVKYLKLNTTEAKLKPLIMNTNGTSVGLKGLVGRENPLGALLVRQSCPAGYGECTNPVGTCCPLGGDCCSDAGCCDTGRRCCSGGGCCGIEDYCATVDGRRGCCPIGEVCGGFSGQCSSSGYSPCPGEEFCCPTGETCFRDSANQVRCRSSSGGGGATTTTPRTTTTSIRTSTPTTTTTTPATSSSSSRVTTTVVIPRPTAPPGSQVVQVAPTDPRVVYNGAWQTIESACNATSQSRMATDSLTSFTFNFQGSAVYLSLSTFNVWYTVSVGGEATDFGTITSTQAPSNCTLSFGQSVLSTVLQSLTVRIHGASLTSSASDPWSFALDEISIVTSATDGTGANPARTTIVSDNSSGNGGLPYVERGFARVKIFAAVMLVTLLAFF